MPAPRLPPGWGGPKEGYTPQRKAHEVSYNTPLRGGPPSPDDQPDPPSFAPPPDPRLGSTPARKQMISSLVPSLDFSLLRGGHRKPSAPVALAALKSLPSAQKSKTVPSSAGAMAAPLPAPAAAPWPSVFADVGSSSQQKSAAVKPATPVLPGGGAAPTALSAALKLSAPPKEPAEPVAPLADSSSSEDEESEEEESEETSAEVEVVPSHAEPAPPPKQLATAPPPSQKAAEAMHALRHEREAASGASVAVAEGASAAAAGASVAPVGGVAMETPLRPPPSSTAAAMLARLDAVEALARAPPERTPTPLAAAAPQPRSAAQQQQQQPQRLQSQQQPQSQPQPAAAGRRLPQRPPRPAGGALDFLARLEAVEREEASGSGAKPMQPQKGALPAANTTATAATAAAAPPPPLWGAASPHKPSPARQSSPHKQKRSPKRSPHKQKPSPKKSSARRAASPKKPSAVGASSSFDALPAIVAPPALAETLSSTETTSDIDNGSDVASAAASSVTSDACTGNASSAAAGRQREGGESSGAMPPMRPKAKRSSPLRNVPLGRASVHERLQTGAGMDSPARSPAFAKSLPTYGGASGQSPFRTITRDSPLDPALSAANRPRSRHDSRLGSPMKSSKSAGSPARLGYAPARIGSPSRPRSAGLPGSPTPAARRKLPQAGSATPPVQLVAPPPVAVGNRFRGT